MAFPYPWIMKKTTIFHLSVFGFGILSLVGNISLVHAAGTSSAQFLKLGAGARAAAMGDSFSSVSNDVSATYWNPAGLSQMESPQIMLMQNSYLLDTNYQFAGFGLPLRRGGLGLSFQRMDFGSIERYSNNDVKDGSFDAGSLAGSLSWSSQIRENLSLGLTAKFIQESLENEKATGFGGDFGLLYALNNTRFSFSLHNFGSKLKFVQEKEDLPQIIRLGASRSFLEKTLLASVDLSKPNDDKTSIHAGLEYKVQKHIFLRGGYHVTPGNNIDVDGLTGVTGGFGVEFSRFSLDYAFVPFGDLDNTHRVSFLIRFQKI